MEDQKPTKTILWVASSKDDLKIMPKDVVTNIGYALHQAQCGEHPSIAKPLKGFGGASVIELCDDYKGDTFRAVYTVRFEEAIVVLHSFQKKSTHRIATPKREIDLIHARLKLAEELYKKWKSKGGKSNASTK